MLISSRHKTQSIFVLDTILLTLNYYTIVILEKTVFYISLNLVFHYGIRYYNYKQILQLCVVII